MKTLRKNVQDFKNYMLQEEAKRKELKKIANLSSKEPNYHWETSAEAKYMLTQNGMSIVYLAYYIVKHHLDEKQRTEYLKHIAETYKCWYNWRNEPNYEWILEGYGYKTIMKLVDRFTYEEDTQND